MKEMKVKVSIELSEESKQLMERLEALTEVVDIFEPIIIVDDFDESDEPEECQCEYCEMGRDVHADAEIRLLSFDIQEHVEELTGETLSAIKIYEFLREQLGR